MYLLCTLQHAALVEDLKETQKYAVGLTVHFGFSKGALSVNLNIAVRQFCISGTRACICCAWSGQEDRTAVMDRC